MRLSGTRRDVGDLRRRYRKLAVGATAAFVVLAARAVQLQGIEHEAWAAAAQENVTRRIPLPASRGLIRDTVGRIVADNRPAFDVLVTPYLFDLEQDLPRLASVANLDEATRRDIAARIERLPPRRRTHQIVVLRDVDRDRAAAIEQASLSLPGVDVVPRAQRIYPFGTLAAHAIGYLNEVSAAELERDVDDVYRPGDRVGRAGVEREWEALLRGRRGEQRLLVDVRGRPQRAADTGGLAAGAVRRDPVPGRDVTLTIDMDLMRAIDRAFRGHPSGAAVVVEVHTGRVRALYAKPAFDPNELSGRIRPEAYAALLDNPFRPLIDKTTFETYFPGSTFKPIAALAALAQDGFDPGARVTCTGVHEIGRERKRCTQVHGEVDLRAAIVRSCNVYFYRLAEIVGLQSLNLMAQRFGFGEPTGIGLPSEASGFLATREWYERHFGRWRTGYALNTAIGQGNTRVTLLQLAMAYAAIANGGTLYQPLLVERISEPDGTPIAHFEPRVRRRVGVPREHLALLVDGLYGVVNDPQGTAYDARIPDGVPIAGKTGTAEVRGRLAGAEELKRAWYFRRDHAWFAGFAPAGDPHVAIAVLVEHGGGGGRYAAPIAMQILQEYLGTTGAAEASGRGR
ncbi:MAG: penicillin-binding protein 2 [Myxococcales bacterium]|nr:penicillin-binding protein 2 [Myxococcales bacterium]